jgi:hypothetical protein
MASTTFPPFSCTVALVTLAYLGLLLLVDKTSAFPLLSPNTTTLNIAVFVQDPSHEGQVFLQYPLQFTLGPDALWGEQEWVVKGMLVWQSEINKKGTFLAYVRMCVSKSLCIVPLLNSVVPQVAFLSAVHVV